MSPLYHASGGGTAGLRSILSSGVLRRGESAEPGLDKRTVSLTRDFEFARRWAGNGIVLELDQQKLTHNYKIVPYNYFSDVTRQPPIKSIGRRNYNFFNQFEEAVLADIKPIERYITKIMVPSDMIPTLSYEIRNHPKLYNYETKKWVNK